MAAHEMRRDGVAADAMEAVAARDIVAGQHLFLALVGIADRGAFALEPADLAGLRLKPDRHARGEIRHDHVLHHFLLAVDIDLAAGQPGDVDAMALAVEQEFDALMHHGLLVEAVGHAGFRQKIHGALLQQARANATFHIGAAARFQHNARYALQMQHAGKQKACGSGADDADLGMHVALLQKRRDGRLY